MKILVATDGSKHSLRAVKHALQLSEQLKTPAQITLISVHENTAFAHASHFVGKKAVDDYLADLAQAGDGGQRDDIAVLVLRRGPGS